MAFYDPYKSSDSYYDPQNNMQAGSGESALGQAKSMLGNMIGFAITQTVVTGAVGALGKKFAQSQATRSASILKNSKSLTARQKTIHQRISKAKTGTEALASRSDRAYKIYNDYKSKTANIDSILAKRQSAIDEMKYKSKIDAGKYRFKSAFKDAKTFGAVAGNNFKKSVLTGSILGYAWDGATGQLEDMGVKGNIAAWNIPGHAINYTKYMAKNMGMFGVMGNLGGIFNVGASAVSGAARTAFSSNKGFSKLIHSNAARVSKSNFSGAVNSNRDNVLKDVNAQFQSNINKSIFSKGVAAVGAAMSTTADSILPLMRRGLYSAFEKKPTNTTTGQASSTTRDQFYERVKRGVSQVKANFKAKKAGLEKKLAQDANGFDIINQLDKHGFGVGQLNLTKDHADSTAAFKELFTEPRQHRNVLADILGLKPTRMKDVLSGGYVHDLTNVLSDRFAIKDKTMIANMINNVKVGDTHYRGSKFNVDLKYMQPLSWLKRAGSVLGNASFQMLNKVPMVGKRLSLAGITSMETLMSSEVRAGEFNTAETGYGYTLKDSTGRTRTLQEVLSDQTDYKSIETISDVSVHFANNKYYTIDQNQIKILDTYNSYITNTTPSISGRSEFKQSDRTRRLTENAKGTTLGRQSGALYAFGKLMKGERFNGGVLGFLGDAFNFDHVSAKNKINELRNVLGTKINNSTGQLQSKTEQLYETLISQMYGESPIKNRSNFVSASKAMMDTTEQSVFRMLQMPEVQEAIGKRSAKHLGNDWSYIFDDDFFGRLLQDAKNGQMPTDLIDDAFFARLIGNDETKKLYHASLHNPKGAKRHIASERLGHFSALSTYDKMKVQYVAEAGGMADQTIHPFVSAAKELQEAGIINHTEAMDMKIYGATRTMFKDSKTGLFGKGELGVKENEAVNKIFKRFKEGLYFEQNDMVDYVRNNQLRKPLLTKSKTRIHQMAEAFDDLNNDNISVFNTDHTSFVGFHYKKGDNKNLAILQGVLDVGSQRVMNLFSDFTGLQNDPFRHGDGIAGAARFLGSTAVKVSAAALAYKAADAVVASSPIFNNTSLDAGITGGLANVLAGTHLITSKALNMTGLAGAGRYLEGLMPGFTSSAPGAIAGAALGWSGGPLGVMKGAISGAINQRMLAPYMPDFTKSYEQLSAEYRGEEEVPIIKGRGWLLGNTPWQGNKVIGWKPNWYVESQSRWKASDTLYGSEVRKLLHEPLPMTGMSLGDFVDPYYMERKHFFTRPYPTTGGWQENAPFGVGPLLSATLGKLFKPNVAMHEEFLKGSNEGEMTEVSAMPIPAQNEHAVFMQSGGSGNPRMNHIKTTSFMGGYTYSDHKMWSQNVADDMLRDLEDGMGLVGFAGNTARGALVDKSRYYPTLETAGRMASMSRGYYDQNLGGMGTLSEAMRRFVRRPEHRYYGINPIPNMLPNWLPERFMTGDPFEKIAKGELRLPGAAYERTHDINFTLPGRASMFGGEIKDIVSYFTGFKSPLLKEEQDILSTGTHFHESIQNWLKAENILISAENLFYDAKNNISGHIDGIINDGFGGKGKRALEIKSISSHGLEKLKGPKYQHVGQLNFYLHESKMDKGTILYVNRDNPSDFKVYDINYNESRYNKDLQKIHKARSIASQMLTKGKQGMAKGFSYSWIDRLNVLSDVAPASKQWKEAKYIVQQQIKNGMINDRELAKYHKAVKHREATLRTYELYPTRFKGQIMSPDSERNIQSLNNNIKAASEYSLPERVVGAAWEHFVNTDTALVNKFFAFKDPIEHYKTNQVYGKEFAPWTDPWGTWGAPRAHRILGASDPFRGAVSGGLDIGYLLGGSPMAMIGAAAGAAAGTVNMVAGGKKNWLPSKIRKEREINDYYDTLDYYKNERMAQLSEGLESDRYRNNANQTFMGLMSNDSTNYTNIYRAAYDSERPYISAWLNEHDEGRQQDILKIVPDRLGHVLKGHWKQMGSEINTRSLIDDMSSNFINKTHNPTYDMQQLDPSLRTEDMKVKTIQSEGLNAHDFGLGWGEQMVRMQNQGDIPINNMDYSETKTSVTNPGNIKSAILNILQQNGLWGRVKVYINNHVDDGENRINITLQHNRLQEIRSAVSFRERFM